MGDIPHPLHGKSARSFSGKTNPKRAQNDVFVSSKVKNEPKSPCNRPKGLNMHEKRQKIRVFGPKIPVFKQNFP